MDSEEGLEMIIDSSGSNLSIGETQLISIARALLKVFHQINGVCIKKITVIYCFLCGYLLIEK